MRERLAWSNVKLLRAILVFLDTQTWHPLSAVSGESDSESESSANYKSLAEVRVAVDLIATTFREPLEAVGVNLLSNSLRPNHRGSGVCTELPLNRDGRLPQSVVQAACVP